LTPCGGTHASHTGEVGIIAVRSWERAKGLTRIEFLAGRRALEDYRRANKTARSVAALFSAGRDDAPSWPNACSKKKQGAPPPPARFGRGRFASGSRSLGSRRPKFQKQACELSLRRLNAAMRISQAACASAHYAPEGCGVAWFKPARLYRLVFARSTDAPGDMNMLMRDACAMIDGRGGGKPELAQGGGRNVDQLVEAIK